MGEPRIDVHAASAAPPERVWVLLADATTWPGWSSFDEAEIERPGDDDPQGVGARRRFRRGRVRSLERIIAFEPPRHVAYALLSGLPSRDHRGDVTLTPTGTDAPRGEPLQDVERFVNRTTQFHARTSRAPGTFMIGAAHG